MTEPTVYEKIKKDVESRGKTVVAFMPEKPDDDVDMCFEWNDGLKVIFGVVPTELAKLPLYVPQIGETPPFSAGVRFRMSVPRHLFNN